MGIMEAARFPSAEGRAEDGDCILMQGAYEIFMPRILPGGIDRHEWRVSRMETYERATHLDV